MFANRFTAFVDACSLAGALNRNILLSLAEAEFFRVRWSEDVMQETERAIERILSRKGEENASEIAAKQRKSMERAFGDAMVSDYSAFGSSSYGLPDQRDHHVLAAALKTKAQIIVTENLKHFPDTVLTALGIEAKNADNFIADTIELDEGRAVAALRRMRERFEDPAIDADQLLLRMDAYGLAETVNVLAPHIASL